MSNFYTEPFVSAGEMEFPSEPYITAQPQNHTATGPEEYVLKVIAAGAVSYQWEVFDGESWSTISGATSDTLTISIDSSMNGWRYRVLVTGADSSTVVSKAAQIAVKGVQEITLEGAIVTFTGPARIKSLVVDINAVQSGSGDPSPTNIRPISGWDAVNVTDCGKNLLNASAVTWTAGLRDDNGNIVSSQSHFTNTVYGIKPNTAYTINGTLSDGTSTFRIYYLTKQDGWISRTASTRTIPYTFTAPANCEAIQIQVGTTLTSLADVMLEEGSTASSYESYQGTTYPINLGQTVYGGTLDVTSGVLTVTHGYILFDGTQSASDFTLSVNPQGIQNNRITWIPYANIGKIGSKSFMSDTLASTNLYTSAPSEWVVSNSGSAVARCYIGVPSTITSVADWLAYCTANPIQLVYELATPIEITLSDYPAITTLTGTNNIWADSGDIKVTIIR